MNDEIEIKLESIPLAKAPTTTSAKDRKPQSCIAMCCYLEEEEGGGAKKKTENKPNAQCCELPPMILSASDVLADTRGTLFKYLSGFAIFLNFVLAVAALIIITQSWNRCAGTWLNVFVLVCMFLSILTTVVVGVLSQRFSLPVKVFALAVFAGDAAWGAVGIWLLVKDAACLQDPGRALWIVALVWTIVMFLPGVFMFTYCIFQIGGGALLEKGIIMGPITKLFVGARGSQPARLNVCLMGDSGTGKTTVLKHGWENRFRLVHSGTTTTTPKQMDKSEHHYQFRVDNVTFTEVQAKKSPLPTMDLTGCDCVILFFSLADRRTLRNARKKWLTHAQALCSAPLLLVGTHAAERRALTRDRLRRTVAAASVEIHPALLEPSKHTMFCIASVSPSVLFRIFGYLTEERDLAAASQVCRHWLILTQHPFVVRNRETAPVRPREITAWMEEMKENNSALNAAGFRGASGYLEISPNARSALKLLKRARKLATDSSSKLMVIRGFDDRGRDTILFRKP